MSYFVTLAFDIHEGKWEDYEKIYSELKAIGLSREVIGDSGASSRLPDTTTAGTFSGSSAKNVRDAIADKADLALSEIDLKARYLWLMVMIGHGVFATPK